MEVGEAQRLQSLGLGQRLSFAYFRSYTQSRSRAAPARATLAQEHPPMIAASGSG